MTEKKDIVVIGAGAAGLMCAIEAGKRGRDVIIVDRAEKPGQKILVSGGGRCNFTNIECGAENYVSRNPHFCKSALSSYTGQDFVELLRKHGMSFTEENMGRLFCAGGGRAILDMLLRECQHAGVSVRMGVHVEAVQHAGIREFAVQCGDTTFECQSLVVATGGLSAPTVTGGFSGYDIARQFGVNVWPLSPGLAPLIVNPADRKTFSDLSGIDINVTVTRGKRKLSGELLFTHKGLSGPVILQTSLYWHDGEEIVIDFLPGIDLVEILKQEQQAFPNRKFKSVLGRFLPRRVVSVMSPGDITENRMAAISHGRFRQVAEVFGRWRTRPAGVAGYDCAEVTVGGVDCNDVSSKTMEARGIPGLFFAGEVLDVSGWLGGYNLQWAWSSGWCAGQHA